MGIIKLTLYLALCFNEVDSQTVDISGVSGVSTNINIICSSNDEEITSPTFWMINGSVYGLLHVPNEFVVCSLFRCDLTTLTIPVVQSEMNGYTFQCVSVDHYNNTQQLRTLAKLSVTTSSFNGMYSST